MSTLPQKYESYRERIRLGSLHILAEEYPFYTFIIGYYIEQVQDIEQLFQLVEHIWSVSQKKTISASTISEILELLVEKPNEIIKINNALYSFEREPAFDLLKAIEEVRTGKINDKKLKASTSKDTIRLDEESQNERLSSKEHTEEMDEDFALALKLQQQQNKAGPLKHQEEDIPCQICYVPLYESQYYLLEKCGHLYHTNCLSQGFKAQISQNKFPLVCPDEKCKTEVINSDVKQILSKELFAKYQEHTIKSYAQTNHDSISWCPTADCGYMFFFEKDDEERFTCSVCKKEYCLNCRVEWHKDMTCKEYKISSTVSQDDQKFMKFVVGKKFKQCPKCKFWVEKNQGCDHMTCKCKFQFCYKCGGVYMKCECMEAAKREQERRQRLAIERRQKKEERLRKAQQKRMAAEAQQAKESRRRKR